MKKFAGCFKFGCFAFLVLAIAIGWSTWQVSQREKHQEEAKVTDAQFSKYTGAKGPPAEATDDSKARYRKGRLLPINVQAGMVDEIYYTLPADFRATKADDVGTVAWLQWVSQTKGHYDNGGAAVKTDCDIVVYDVARKAIVAREHIEGDEPPSVVSHERGSKIGWGKLPTEKVVGFLKSLPVR